MRLQARGQRRDAGARDTGRALGGDDHEDQQTDLLAQVHGHVHGFRDEDGGQREIDGGAVEVEGVTSRDHDADGGLFHAEVLHLAHEVRQRGLGGRGREDEEELAAQVLAQLPHGDAAEDAGDGTEYEEDEEETRDVERQHEDGERLHGIEAGGANHAGHGAERADGCDPEDHRQQLEHEALEVRNEREDGLTRRAHGLHGEAAE